MKTIEIQLFKFDELSDEAKQTALENNANEAEYFWGYDAIKSLQKVAEHFKCSLKHYSIDWINSYRNEISFDCNYVEFSNEDLKTQILSMGDYDKKTLKGLGECKFTGYQADESVCDGIRIAYFNGERDLKELLMSGYESWYDDCKTDYEYQLSEEGYSEHCEANDYDFTEDGEMY
jgi:hypothetical protein